MPEHTYLQWPLFRRSIVAAFQRLLTTMKSDGSDVERLTVTKHHNTNPWWSPDGKWVVYTDGRQEGNDLFVVPSEGGPAMRVTYRGASWPRWSPRGDALVFTSSRRGHLGLFLMGVPKEFLDYKSAVSK
jgi:Tol biopolymer transport system component